jgi:hypothetical protein
MGQGFVVQPWTTIRGNGPNVTSIIQDAEEWLMLDGYGDVAFLIDAADVTLPSGIGSISLDLESAPTPDSALFLGVAPTIAISSASAAPVRAKSIRCASTGALVAFLRWKISIPGGSIGSWGLTFRIHAIPGKSQFFYPRNLAGCVFWVRADLGITMDGSNLVSAWADQSEFQETNKTCTQGDPVKKPTFNASNTNYGGQPTIDFNASGSMFSGTWTTPPPPHGTTFIVGNADGTNNPCLFIDGIDSNRFLFYQNTSNSVDAWHGHDLGYSPTTPGSKHIYAIDYNAASSAIYQDAITAVATGDTGTNAPIGVTLGGQLNGSLAEIIIYNRTLSDNERALVFRYLGARYGVAIGP